jgi:putative ABC transport system ATP-binding protein
MDMISLKNIEKTFQTDSIETAALSEISMDIKKGEFISVMGPSGCGKSTLLSIIGLLDIPTKGQVLINNESPLEYKDAKLSAFRNKMLGFVFQSFHLINDLSVIDNVELPLLYRRISGSERKQKALAALGKVGLSNRIDHYPSQLSGGQKQRVAIARAIVGQPEIILADEPTGNLDSHMGNEIMEILQNLNETEKTTIIMVTHDESLARKTNRLIRLFDGKQVF